MTVCKNCNGSGYTESPYYPGVVECFYCDGTGVVEPMTNEEYIHSLNTEQLAEYLADKFNEVVDFVLHEVDENAGDIEPDDYWYRQSVVAEWLKQPHTFE